MKLSNEVKTGILVTAALAALLWGLNYLKGKDLFTSRNKYYAVYDDVDGLVKSNPVLMNGFRIGIVDNISFMPDHSGRLVLTLLITEDVFVSKNSVAQIFDSDLIGTKALRIQLGNDPTALADKDTLYGEVDKGLAGTFAPLKDKAESLVQNLDSVMLMLRQTFNQDFRQNLQSGVGHLNHTLASIDEMVGSDQGKFRIMIANLSSITTNLKNNNEKITNILQNLNAISDSLTQVHFAETIRKADDVLIQTKDLMVKINNGQGSLGLLVNDKSLYNNLDSTAHNLDILIKDLHEHPKKYVHFSVFGKK